MTKELLSTRKYKAGYEVRAYKYSGDDAAGGPDMIMKSAFTTDGGYYVGNSKWAYRIFRVRGLREVQPSREIDCADANNGFGHTCSIGFSKDEQKWYGWSHRAMYGFGIGSNVYKDHLGYVPDNHTEMYNSVRNFFQEWDDDENDWKENRHIRKLTVTEMDGMVIVKGEQKMQNYAEESALDGALVSTTITWQPFSETYRLGRGEWTAQTLSDAKEMACAFAQSVS